METTTHATKALIINNSLTSLERLRECLRACGIGSTCAESLKVARELIGAARYDIILCAIDLVNENSLDLINIVRSRFRPGTVKVIYITTSSTNTTSTQHTDDAIRSLGGDGFIAVDHCSPDMLKKHLAFFMREVHWT